MFQTVLERDLPLNDKRQNGRGGFRRGQKVCDCKPGRGLLSSYQFLYVQQNDGLILVGERSLKRGKNLHVPEMIWDR